MLSFGVEMRTSKYLNNLIEQDHRRVKQWYYPMLGFKKVSTASITLSGTSVGAEDQKGQFDTSSIGHAGAMVPQVRGAVLAA